MHCLQAPRANTAVLWTTRLVWSAGATVIVSPHATQTQRVGAFRTARRASLLAQRAVDATRSMVERPVRCSAPPASMGQRAAVGGTVTTVKPFANAQARFVALIAP